MRNSQYFANECQIRDYYAENFAEFRLNERIIEREHKCGQTAIRADLYSVDCQKIFREWEFKIYADYKALGQILTYVAMARKHSEFKKTIRGVIAAFDFQPEVKEAIEILNLGIEIIQLPNWISGAGKIPLNSTQNIEVVTILNKLNSN